MKPPRWWRRAAAGDAAAVNACCTGSARLRACASVVPRWTTKRFGCSRRTTLTCSSIGRGCSRKRCRNRRAGTAIIVRDETVGIGIAANDASHASRGPARWRRPPPPRRQRSRRKPQKRCRNWRRQRKREPRNTRKSCSPLNAPTNRNLSNTDCTNPNLNPNENGNFQNVQNPQSPRPRRRPASELTAPAVSEPAISGSSTRSTKRTISRRMPRQSWQRLSNV